MIGSTRSLTAAVPARHAPEPGRIRPEPSAVGAPHTRARSLVPRHRSPARASMRRNTEACMVWSGTDAEIKTCPGKALRLRSRPGGAPALQSGQRLRPVPLPPMAATAPALVLQDQPGLAHASRAPARPRACTPNLLIAPIIRATLSPVLWLVISIAGLVIGLFAVYVILVIFFFKKLLRPPKQAVVRKGAAAVRRLWLFARV
jgi:hypothetical protein